ncbi:hypothetical protein GS11_2488 [Mycobacterium tuberculosis variant bovis BCG]|uniref:Uncharacterized protein n=1 Tax=Mycobacterium tuberculosis TaxID=1773 RepID=A0A654U577_MYCTX|nr:hypothetical protein [Mycobacterium tuberculosis]AKO25414.1 hypothetical protein GS11_2488 [Mycobacterium tuberculosis variant bovis BCG]CFA90878.1 Uncharacterised protein [Mycobacterium tuberculosis]CFR98836.1 Uncharacterised protein [Mycobacterium tuberculosis]CFS48670.1 Uncharacterised protein [Mycobacterium tuberculosis]CNM20160.1 Uncharacterised protein [Mycobacterium tuberculosis]
MLGIRLAFPHPFEDHWRIFPTEWLKPDEIMLDTLVGAHAP